MKNQIFTSTPTSTRECACPSTVLAGDFVLVGAEPAVALNSYSSVTGTSVFYFNGTYSGTVIGKSALSPAVNAAIKQGGNIYYDGGTLDATTNVTTGGTLDGNTGATLFGVLDPQYQTTVASGATDTAAWVRIGA